MRVTQQLTKMDETTLLDLLDRSNSVFKASFSHVYFGDLTAKETPPMRPRYTESLKQRAITLADEYPVKHGLSDTQLRILFKILARDLEDCGRKRGAIMRYIKHYEDKATPQGDISMFHALRALDDKTRTF